VAQLAGAELDVRLLVDHRERLVAQRTWLINDLRWGLHDLWPEFEIPPRALIGPTWQDRVGRRLTRAEQSARVRIARDELRRIRELARSIQALEAELAPIVLQLTPGLLAERGCGVLTAAKLIGEIAGIDRFATDAKLARLSGAAPIPASSGRTDRHRLDRGGTRQINCALHRLAISKGRLDPETAAYLARKQAEGKTRREALRCLKRHLARRVFRLLQPPAAPQTALTPIGERPAVISTSGRTIHCNTPTGSSLARGDSEGDYHPHRYDRGGHLLPSPAGGRQVIAVERHHEHESRQHLSRGARPLRGRAAGINHDPRDASETGYDRGNVRLLAPLEVREHGWHRVAASRSSTPTCHGGFLPVYPDDRPTRDGDRDRASRRRGGSGPGLEWQRARLGIGGVVRRDSGRPPTAYWVPHRPGRAAF